ncbi:hypothetical protein ABTY96_45370 [Streptomyces sp. NPDC096057]|uniref:hypothetical protein n=1 Tax=Streptomyces sp. NPDC096057 TaxID=3155543 RepID=UPI0033329BE0
MIRRGTARRGGPADRSAATRLTVSRARAHVHLVHTGGTPPRRLADLADRLGPARPDEAIVLVGASLGEEGVDGLCERLAPVLREFKDDGVRLLRLVMSAGADEAEGRPSTARLICEQWELDVLATAGPAVVVPDGTLFSPGLPDAPGGWWHFSVGEVPRAVGSRLPIPDWEPALRRMDQDAVPDHVVEPVPAGLMIRPTGTASAAVHTLPYAVPPDPDRPHLLVDTATVPAAGLATVIAALPGRVRKDIRLLSLDGSSLLETGQRVADLLGTDVQVANGVPVVVDDVDADGDGTGEVSTELYLVDAEGTPAWRPFAQTLTCVPATDGRTGRAHVTAWRTPAELLQGTEPGALPFDQTWKVALTPAGLWAGPRSSEPPAATGTRVADADTVAIELGAPRRALDDALWPSLDRLFGGLEPEVRERAVVHVHGVLGSKGMEKLRRLTVRHNVSLMPLTPDAAGAAAESEGVYETEGGTARSAGSGPSATESFPSLGRTSAMRTPQARTSRPDGAAEGTQEAEPAAETSTVAPVGTERAAVAETQAPARELPTQTEPEPTPAPLPAGAGADAGMSPEAQEPSRAGRGESAATAPASVPGAFATRPGTAPMPAKPVSSTPPGSSTTTPEEPSEPRPRTPADPARDVPDRGPDLPPASTVPSGPAPVPDAGHASPASPGGTPVTEAPDSIPARRTPSTAPEPAAPPRPPTGAGTFFEPTRRGTAPPRGVDTAGGTGAASAADHVKLREQLGPYWEQHRAALSTIMERLSTGDQRELSDAMTADLVAVHVYMTAVDEAQLRLSLAEGDDRSRTLLRCVRSGMRRLPSYRGAAKSTAQELVARLTPDAAGEEWEATVPVRAVSAARPYPGTSVDHVLIWSVTGRRTGTGADEAGQDILFARESKFRVLGVVRHGAATVGLLQEMPPQAHNPSAQLDAALLKRLRNMLAPPSAEPGPGADPPVPHTGTAPFPNPVA